MIIFSGEINNNNKKFIKKQQLKVAIILASLMIFFGCVPIGIIIGILFQMNLAEYILFFVLSTAFIIIVNFFGKSIGDYPNEIIITEENITAKTKKCEMKAPINKVTEILDTGDSFIFKFHFPRLNAHFVCQKDLLKEGDLEAFERMFEGKIIARSIS